MKEIIALTIKPNHVHTEIISQDPLVIGVKAPAQDNKANIALLKFLEKQYGKKARIKSGRTSKKKLVELY